MVEIFTNNFFVYFVVPILILCARLIDVSLGTIRIILANKGIKVYSSLIGFFEVLVWLFAITTIMNNLTNVFSYFAYALGFSLGTYLGITLEEKISIGQVRLRIITKKNLKKMLEELNHTRYVFVSDSANSSEGKIKIINAFLERKDLKTVLIKVKAVDPHAFYTVEDLKLLKKMPKEEKIVFGVEKAK